MSDKPENPLAFPISTLTSFHKESGTATHVGCNGMTLRDYFAAKVAQGLVRYDNTDTPEWVAARAYRISDELLKERNRK